MSPLFQAFLFLALYLLDALLWCRQILWHRATQFLYGLSNFLAYLVMSAVSSLLALDILAPKFGVGLCSSKNIISQLL